MKYSRIFGFPTALILAFHSLQWLREADAAEPSQETQESDDEHRHVEASTDLTQLGDATWVDGRVDVPVFRNWTVFPQGALLHVAASGPADSDEWHPFFGGGIAWEPSNQWRVEGSGLYGPSADDVESVAAEIEVERDMGGDDDTGIPPTFELEGSLTVKHVRWEDGMGPAGSDVTQAFVDLQPLWRPTPRLELRPRAMVFFYDEALDHATGDRLGSIMVLARIGTFAPLALGGASVGYRVRRWLTPVVQASEIVYASGIGSATEVLLGAGVKVVSGWNVSLAGGWLWNHVGGSLVPPDAPSSLPVVTAGLTTTF